MKKVLLSLSMALFVSLLSHSVVFAEEAVDRPFRSSFYVGLLVPRNSFSGGDFDGNTFYHDASFTEVTVVPKIEDAFGIGLVTGFRRTLRSNVGVGFEFSFEQTKHSSRWLNIPFDVTANLLNLDFKLFGRANQPVQPYAQLGLCLPFLTVKNGDATFSQERDVTYSGLGYNLGFGLQYFVTSQVGLNVAAIFRQLSFDQSDRIARGSKLDKKIETGDLDFELGLTYHFKIR